MIFVSKLFFDPLGFFDDDRGQRTIGRAFFDRGDLVHDVHAFDNLAERGILAIEPRAIRVADEELAARKAKWVAPEPKVKTGYLARYAKLVSSADKGAILQ